MKKTFFIIVCISPSFLCSMEEKPKMPPSRSQSAPLGSNSPLIQGGESSTRNKIRLDSDPIQQKVDPNLQRVRSQSRETIRIITDENRGSLYDRNKLAEATK